MYLKQAPSGMYHVRIRVPAEVQPILGRTEMHCSLGTRSRREAEQRARPIIARMRAQIFKAQAKIGSDQYRADILRAKADSLTPFDAVDQHFEEQHPNHTLEQLKQFMAQLSTPTETPPSEPARTVMTALSDLTPYTAIVDYIGDIPNLGKDAIHNRRFALELFMKHIEPEGIFYLEHTKPDHWQSWCREISASGLSAGTISNRTSQARASIRDYLVSRGRTFNASDWITVKTSRTSRAELEARRDANSPFTLERWQELYDKQVALGFKDASDIFALGLLTGARVQEIIFMDTSQLDLTLNEWRIPEHVAKTVASIRMIPLTPMALDIINHRLAQSGDGHPFKPSATPDRTYGNWVSKVRHARSRAGAIEKVETQHSTRSTFRTLAPRMAPASTPVGVIEAIMGHELGGQIASATKHYLRAFEPDAHEFMSYWRPAISIRQSRA